MTSRHWVILLLITLAAGCGRAPQVAAPDPDRPPDVPADARVYRVSPVDSELRVLVYRAGTLASLGHNHVISSQSLSGKVWLGKDPRQAALRITLPVADLQIDLPALRDEEGDDFPGELDQDAIDGTRENMLGERVLNAELFPEISLTSRGVSGELPDLTIATDVALRGQINRIDIPARVTLDGDLLQASGEFAVLHADLGLEPFSVFLGALAVADELTIKYRLTAVRE
ncbi:MAG: YceI family protein [Gammaproteobacteria bacterium]|nr:YceI family protein [Gammaproteobacteria bacterium]